MKLHLEILPAPQKEFWDDLAVAVPPHIVLYGGTAIALRLGHRQSVDFDFFTDRGLEFDRLVAAMPFLQSATILDRRPNTFTLSLPMSSGDVKLSFFGGLSFGRVGVPDRVQGNLSLASSLDLLANKLKTIHDRIVPRDYVDIEALLRSGLSLDQGIAGARALYGQLLNPLDTAKAVGWFKDGELDRKLSGSTRDFLTEASARFDPQVTPLPIKSRSLSPDKPFSCRAP
jgi:hypothetical protein